MILRKDGRESEVVNFTVGFASNFFFYFTLQYCIGFAIYQHESTMGVHVFLIRHPLSHLHPHTIPLGHPSAPAPSILYHALNLDWRFISNMILYMFQCHSWIPLLITNRPSMQKISKEKENLDSSLNKLYLTYSYRRSTQWQCNINSFSSVHEIFSNI